jgi:hypothetical protein
MSTHLFDTLPHDGDTIRLLVLEPALKPETSIRCRLITTKMSNRRTYEALSYTWGEPTPTRLLHIDMTAVEIRSNLHDCLLRLRNTEESRALWIDAICVNQNDDEEKSHQIELMPHIYAGAKQVVAWLGESANGSDDVLTWVLDHSRDFPSRVQPPKNLLEPITRFFERQYWYRTWIIQELLKAQKQLFICGGCQISAFQLFCVMKKCTQGELRERLEILVRGFWEDSPLAPRAKTFPKLLQLSFNTHCTDDRDKIYALLGLLRVTDPFYVLKADYSISTTELLQKVLSITNIYVDDGGDDLQVLILLKALNLRWSALKFTCNFPALGKDRIWHNLIFRKRIPALRKCTGVTLLKTKDVRVGDLFLASPKTPNCYFAFRQAQQPRYDQVPLHDREWICIGLTWASHHTCAGDCFDLKASDHFFKDFQRYCSRYVVVDCEKDINMERRISYIVVPKLVSAASQLYVLETKSLGL